MLGFKKSKQKQDVWDSVPELTEEEELRRTEFIPDFLDGPLFKKNGPDALFSFDCEGPLFTIPEKLEASGVEAEEVVQEQQVEEPLPELTARESESHEVVDNLMKPLKKVDSHVRDMIVDDVPEDKLDVIIQKSEEISKSQSEEIVSFGKDDEDETLFNYAKAPLASTEQIKILEEKHMEFYNILAKIQDTHAANDFRSAYNIQDKISYLLNHPTLLYESLVEQLLKYIDSIIEKLDSYYDLIVVKQQKFKVQNEKVSALKNYKWKTDESVQIISENQRLAKEELEKAKI